MTSLETDDPWATGSPALTDGQTFPPLPDRLATLGASTAYASSTRT